MRWEDGRRRSRNLRRLCASLRRSRTFISRWVTCTGKPQQYEEAKKEFEQELALNPNHEQALTLLADIEWKNNHPEAALPLLQKAVQGNKDFRIAYVELGAIYLAQKNYKEAEPALLQAVKLEPGEPDAHYQLGTAYTRLREEKAEAEKELEKVRELRKKADESDAGKPPAQARSEDS